MRLIDADKILEDVYPVEIMIVDKIRNAPTVDFGVDLDRLKELSKADKEGRCLVLPCKVGDTVYRIQEAQLKENCKKARFVRSVILNKHNFWRIIFGGEFGEKVFLTKEKAEKALEGLE